MLCNVHTWLNVSFGTAASSKATSSCSYELVSAGVQMIAFSSSTPPPLEKHLTDCFQQRFSENTYWLTARPPRRKKSPPRSAYSQILEHNIPAYITTTNEKHASSALRGFFLKTLVPIFMMFYDRPLPHVFLNSFKRTCSLFQDLQRTSGRAVHSNRLPSSFSYIFFFCKSSQPDMWNCIRSIIKYIAIPT